MDPLLQLQGVEKSFGPIKALTKTNLSLKKREVVALIGDNGAGKSTIIKILSGALAADSGTLEMNGKRIQLRHHSVRKARKMGIETVYQERSLGEKQPLWRNVFVGRHIRNRFGMIDVGREKTLTMEMLQNSIGLKGVGISADALVGTLSGGERQGLAISRAIHFNAPLTILDEPTTALSIKEVNRVLNFIREIPKQGGTALFVSHNLHHVHAIADRFIFVHSGTVSESCSKKQMTLAELFEKVDKISQFSPFKKAV